MPLIDRYGIRFEERDFPIQLVIELWIEFEPFFSISVPELMRQNSLYFVMALEFFRGSCGMRHMS